MAEGVPLRQALRLAPLEHARVVAGAAGLDRLVSHVNVMEVPDITAWVKPNQLLLTTGYPLRDDRAALTELVPRLADLGLAGLAIKPARYIEAIPDGMIEAADRLGFPLLELPPDTAFEEIINAVLGLMLNAQAVRLQRSAAIHGRFTGIALSGGGLREIVQALAELIHRPAAVVGPDGLVLARSTDATLLGSDRLDLPLAEQPLGGREHPVLQQSSPAAGPARRPFAVQPILIDAWRRGAIVVDVSGGTLDDDELVAVEHAATVAALRLAQERAVVETDRRFRAICLEELVSGQVVDRDLLRERALASGWDLAIPRAVLVAELEELGGRRFSELVGTPDESLAWHRLAEAASDALGKSAIVWERSAGVAALVAAGGMRSAELRDAAGRLQAAAARRLPGAVVAVGIGRVCDDPLDLHHSQLEAVRALQVGRRVRGTGQVSLFEDLGIDRLLASCPRGELAAFCEATLGQLEAYDGTYRTDLVGTLEAYFAHGRNASRAARARYVHYNTFQNRLARIEQLLGPILDDPERSLDLALALRIRRVLGH